jgi:hypothetical protein
MNDSDLITRAEVRDYLQTLTDSVTAALEQYVTRDVLQAVVDQVNAELRAQRTTLDTVVALASMSEARAALGGDAAPVMLNVAPGAFVAEVVTGPTKTVTTFERDLSGLVQSSTAHETPV